MLAELVIIIVVYESPQSTRTPVEKAPIGREPPIAPSCVACNDRA